MPTWTALTTLADREAAETLGESLEAVRPAATGVGVFEIEDGSGRWEVGGYFTERPDEIALAVLAAASGAAPFAVSKLPDTDWVAHVRRELSPVRAGRFVIHGPHDPAPGAPLRSLVIEAAMAFGTGHHATTVGCLLAMQALARGGFTPRRVADVGCGTGVLAMAAARIWRAPVVASDIDAIAVATARANAIANGAAPWVRVVTAAGLRHPLLRDGPRFDLICANILARPLRRLAPSFATRAATGAAVVLSGILDRQAAAVESTFAAHGFRRGTLLRRDGWTTLTLRRV